MALFGSRLRAVPLVDENIGGGFAPMPAPVPTQNDMLKAEAMKNVPRRRGLFGGGRGGDALMVIGAALRGGDDMPAVMELIGERAKAAQQAELNAQIAPYLTGGGEGGGVGAIPPAVLFQLAASGHPGAQALLTMRGQDSPETYVGPDGVIRNRKAAGDIGQRVSNPTNIGNTVVDLSDQENINRVIAEAPVKGAMPVYDNRGRVVDWQMPQGAIGAIGAAAGAEAGARARYNTVTGTDAQGRPVVTTADRIAGTPMVGQSPADAAAARVQAEAGAQGQVDLPGALQKAQNALDVIEQVRMHPGRSMATGVFGGLPTLPGTKGRDFEVMVKQLGGQTFLEAYQSLKGGGQITEVEGRKAEAAIARLDRAQTPEGFEAALNDLESVIRAGMERAQQRAGQGTRPTGSARPPSRAEIEAELRRRGLR